MNEKNLKNLGKYKLNIPSSFSAHSQHIDASSWHLTSHPNVYGIPFGIRHGHKDFMNLQLMCISFTSVPQNLNKRGILYKARKWNRGVEVDFRITKRHSRKGFVFHAKTLEH